MKNQRYYYYIFSFLALAQIGILSSCERKVAAKNPSLSNTSTKKQVAVCCKSGIPSRFDVPVSGIIRSGKK